MKTWAKLLLGLGAAVAGVGIYGSVNALAPANVNGCQYLASPPTLSDLQTSIIQCDSAGKLLTTAVITPSGTQDVNLTKVGGAAVALGQALAGSSIPVVLPAATSVPVTLASGAVASGAYASGALAAGSVASGAVASGAVASGAFASGALALGAIADGADVTQGAKADAKSTATDTTPITVMSVLKEISAMAQVPAALPANQSTNVAQINATTPLMGSGNTGTGSLRVTVATDNPALAVTPTGSFTAADGAALTSTLKDYALGGVYNGSTFDMNREATNSLNSTGTGLPASQPVGQCDDTSPTAITENSFGNARINCTTHAQYVEALPSASAASGIAAVVSTTLETGHVLKNAAGNLYSVTFTTTTVAGYGGVSNATAVPAAGAVTPVASCYAPAFGTCTIQYSPPLVLSTGISAWFSIAATPFTKTDSATAMITGQVM